jgi:hypothetical protein
MKKFFLRGAIGLLSLSLLVSSCKKQPETPTEDLAAVDDLNEAYGQSDDAVEVAELVMADRNSAMRTTEDMQTAADYCGAAITLTQKTDSQNGRIEIDFGTGKTCGNKTRKGKIIITFNGRYRVPGTTQELTFDNYYVNNKRIEGRKTFTHTFANNKYNTRIVVSGGKITFADGTKVEWISDRVRTWDSKGTPSLADDEVTVTGTLSGKDKATKSFTAQITSPILLKASCLESIGAVPVSGVLEITPEGKATRVINYGGGACDRNYTVTVNNFTFNRTMN